MHQGGFGGRLQMLLHQAAQVVAIDHARNEALTQLAVAHGVELRTGPQPLHEMVGHLRKGGHIPRGDVKQMLWTPGTVSDAAGGGAMLIEDRHVERAAVETCQIHGRHHTAEAAANDGDCVRQRMRHKLRLEAGTSTAEKGESSRAGASSRYSAPGSRRCKAEGNSALPVV